jgi:hypothetical protein
MTMHPRNFNIKSSVIVLTSASVLSMMLLTGTVVYAWQLDVDLRRSTFGSDRVCAAIHGPYGYDRTKCTESGPNAGVSFSVPEDEVPSGYDYKVCAWGGIASLILQNCQWFTHGTGDESVWLDVGG